MKPADPAGKAAPWEPVASLETLQFKARLLQRIRAFFIARDCLEVETPLLSRAGTTDPNIESFALRIGEEQRWLITSPEFHMKRLLAAGSGSIFQIARVFRDRERGGRHNPEFSLLEWYRVGWDYRQLMAEVEELLRHLLPVDPGPARYLSYRQLFLNYLQLDPLDADFAALHACWLRDHGPVQGLVAGDRDGLLDLLFGAALQPRLRGQGLVFVHDFPASQASLARLRADDNRLAERFEVFIDGMELGNGFSELTDAQEQGRRFAADLQRRAGAGQAPVSRDELLLAALGHGMPACAGVAIGVDRLCMVAQGHAQIDATLAFPWERA